MVNPARPEENQRMNERLLDSFEVAERLHISRSYAALLMRRGEIRIVRIGRLLRVRPEDLARYIEKHAHAEELAGAPLPLATHTHRPLKK